MNRAPRIAVLGETMIELSPAGLDLMQLGVAGDTYNAAVMMSRLGASVIYLTALGDDAYSDKILAAMHHHRLDTAGILRLSGRLPGLYAISTSESGERSFSYWRDSSAARQAFMTQTLTEGFLRRACAEPNIYWSGITLALMSAECRDRFLTGLAEYRALGGRVFFDTNFRPALWRSERDDAAGWYERAIAQSDVLLPSAQDIDAIFGVPADEPVDLLAGFGASTIALTVAAAVILRDGGETVRIPLEFRETVVDTTGAGDAFSGAFVAAILRGERASRAVGAGHEAASRVVQVPGAILPEQAWGSLLESASRG